MYPRSHCHGSSPFSLCLDLSLRIGMEFFDIGQEEGINGRGAFRLPRRRLVRRAIQAKNELSQNRVLDLVIRRQTPGM
jgi:hypothetical protein